MIPKSRVESVKQSPMNPRRWCLQLDCGHDEWITAQRRPQRMQHRCSMCAARARAIIAEEK